MQVEGKQQKPYPMNFIRYKTSPLYNPASNFPNLRDEMDRLFDAAFPALSSVQRGFFGDVRGEFPVDLHQNKDAFVVRAETSRAKSSRINTRAKSSLRLTILRYLMIRYHMNSRTRKSSDA